MPGLAGRAGSSPSLARMRTWLGRRRQADGARLRQPVLAESTKVPDALGGGVVLEAAPGPTSR